MKIRVGYLAPATLGCLLLAPSYRLAEQPAPRRGENPPAVAFDHVWIVVKTGAPERRAVERAGFRFWPTVHEHEGQGTASITADFENGFFELLWPDPKVPVAPGGERGHEKFVKRMEWRTSGWSPIGVAVRRMGPSTDPFPFPTWSISPAWLPPGKAIEILTPRDDARSPSLFVIPPGSPRPVSKHPIGVRRITAVRLVMPRDYRPIEPLSYLVGAGVLTVRPGNAWAIELTFDGGARKRTKDFRPELPLSIRY